MSATTQPKKRKKMPQPGNIIEAPKEVKIVPQTPDGTYCDIEGVARMLAIVSKINTKTHKQVINLAKTTCYIMENNKKRELTTEEASAFVRSGYANPPR